MHIHIVDLNFLLFSAAAGRLRHFVGQFVKLSQNILEN